jgi:FG-GAP-like repeat/PPIC-type PPIASE domain/ASPIC and UnbV
MLGVALIASNPRAWSDVAGDSQFAIEIIVVDSRSVGEEILEQIRAGQPFEVLALKYSLNASARDGGYIGKLRLSEMQPEVRNAIRNLPPGQVSELIQTASGYMLVKVLSECERVTVENVEHSLELARTAKGKVQMVRPFPELAAVQYFLDDLVKPPNWELDLQLICALKRRAVSTGVESLQSVLGKPGVDETGLIQAHEALGELWAYSGEMVKALEQLQMAYEKASPGGADSNQLASLEKIGTAYLVQAGLDNSARTTNVQAFFFPPSPAIPYTHTSNSERAVSHFSEYLKLAPLDLEVKWLLNLSYMSLGKYPDGVPRDLLIPPAAFESKADIGRFVNVAPSLGLERFGMAGGIVVDDFDNDGFLDVVVSDLDACAPMHYFHNNGDGTFSDRSVAAGLATQLGGLNMVQADYNNDGNMDILVLRGGWQHPMRNSLLRNNGDGTFTDVTHESGLAAPATETQTAAWADINNDGWIDLFVGNENSPAQLFLNRGDGTFVDIAHAAGVDKVAYTKAVSTGDYDNDGYPDFYVSNWGSENFLYHNNKNGTFTDVARALHVEAPFFSFPAWFFDFDNDGWLDILVFSYLPSAVEVLRSYLSLPLQSETLRLYRNTGHSSFCDVTKTVGLDRVFMPMGSNFGDIDNDGFLDFYLGTGSPSYGCVLPNVLVKNDGGKRFVDITASSGTGDLHKGHGVAFADLAHDGRQDLLCVMGGAIPGDRHAMLVFRNARHENNWINVHLVGVKTNRGAIGARIAVTLIGPDGKHRSVHRVVCSGGSFGASPLAQHIGLGKSGRILTLEIWWPTSNTRQIFHNAAANQYIEVKEFEKDYRRLNKGSVPMGRKAGKH